MKKIIILFFAAFSTLALSAQVKGKLGHIDAQEILNVMPEKAKATKDLEAYAKSLQDQQALMYKEYQTKATFYEEKRDSLSVLIRKTKEEELTNMAQRIQAFEQSAHQELQQKELELQKPITEKLVKAIKEVGAENGFLYIYDENALYYFSADSQDVTPLVKKKLGIN